MHYDNYLELLIETVTTSSVKVKNHIRKKFRNLGIEFEEQTLLPLVTSEGEGSELMPNQILDHQLKNCLEKDKRAIKEFERWEFEKDYKYSVVFEVDNFDELIRVVNQNQPIDDSEHEYTSQRLGNPVYFHMENMSFLKFNLAFSAFHPQTRKELLVKYPFLMVFHIREKIIEFRFDVLKKVFIQDIGDDRFYESLIRRGIIYLESQMGVKLTPIDLNFMIDEAKKQDELKLISQHMKMSNGANATLEVGNNQEYVLPFIGELKSILAEYEDDLKKVPVIKESLEQFIYEKEEMSDYPWVEVLWANDIKTRSIRVKLIFNYLGNDYCLLQHFYNNVLIGMERMNHVIDFIRAHRISDSPASHHS